MSEAEQLEIVIRNLETRLRIARKNLDELNGGSTPEVVTKEANEIWFGLKVFGEWVRNYNNGEIVRFSAEDAYDMPFNPNLPLSWWTNRELVRITDDIT